MVRCSVAVPLGMTLADRSVILWQNRQSGWPGLGTLSARACIAWAGNEREQRAQCARTEAGGAAVALDRGRGRRETMVRVGVGYLPTLLIKPDPPPRSEMWMSRTALYRSGSQEITMHRAYGDTNTHSHKRKHIPSIRKQMIPISY